MREKGRERNSGFLGLKERKDFIDRLFSVYVDNLYSKVDLVCLWNVFKVFGRVRDVYLSSKASVRRSNFAFIRFQTLEEARKVAKMTNGMHMYGWSISSKVASYDWSNRRWIGRGSNERNVLSGVSGLSREGDSCVRLNQFSKLEKRSFTEVVGGNHKCLKDEGGGEEEEKVITMSLDGLKSEKEWLERCAVGVLKSFSNISKVNQRLDSIGFVYSTKYLGDKSILWIFETKV
ncbi:hypothetical protein Dsin_001409 [Dipteronia sinensis]|uniref:RRM domain-containing protein n=1 Tax=Dipteronia sinensis TaxID=43782 RepID=A0AAE0B3Y0_9ROSI|nr:hypothetical protein Dsin_001409 [Dipteronia sinensis]